MGSLIHLLFNPPVPPLLSLPLPSRIATGILGTIKSAIELAYYRGVYDGFIAGAVLTLVLVMRSRRND